MSKAFSEQEIADACSAISNQVQAGIPIHEVVERMSILQKKHASFWVDTAKSVGRGQPVSDSLARAWPEGFVASLRAGEESGNVGEVFADIEVSIEIKREAFGSIKKLLYPVGIAVMGIVMALGFLVFVIPSMMKAIDSPDSEPSIILQVGMFLGDLVQENGTAFLGILGGLVATILFWVMSGTAKRQTDALMIKAPGVGEAVTMIHFAVWSKVMSLMTSAGLPLMSAIAMSVRVLPLTLQPAIRQVQHALERNLPLAKSTQAEREDDDRRFIPFYVANAFRIAEQTGRLDRELDRAAKIMVKDAKRSIERFVVIGKAAAMAFAGTLLVVPLGAYYTEFFKSIQRMM